MTLHPNPHFSHGTIIDVSKPPLYASTTFSKFPRIPPVFFSATSFTSSAAITARTPAEQDYLFNS